MSIGRSWKWLAPRLNAEQLRNGVRAAAAAGTRPCLPTIEALGDRTMLSVSTEAGGVVGENPPVSPEGVLIALIKGELTGSDALVKHEIRYLDSLGEFAKKHIGNVKYEDIRATNLGLMKVHDVLANAFSDLMIVKGNEFLKIRSDLDGAEKKLTDIAKKLDEGSKTQFESEVNRLLSKIEIIFKAVGDGSIKVEGGSKDYVKVNDFATDALNGFLKIREDVIFKKATTGDSKYLEIKLQDVLISSVRVGIKGEVTDDFVKATDALTTFVLSPPKEPGTNGGLGLDSGVVVSATGDILK